MENLSSLIANLFFVNIKPILDIALFLNILCIVQYNLYFVNARALKNPSRNVSAKTLTTNFAIHVKIGRTLLEMQWLVIGIHWNFLLLLAKFLCNEIYKDDLAGDCQVL